MNRIVGWFRPHLKWWIAVLVFVTVTGFLGENSVMERIGQYKEIRSLENEIDSLKRKYEEDNAALQTLKEDHEAVVKVARERYYMKTDDEDIFIIDDKEDGEDE